MALVSLRAPSDFNSLQDFHLHLEEEYVDFCWN